MNIDQVANIIGNSIDLAVKTLIESGDIDDDFHFIVEPERLFVDETNLDPHNVYFVVKFGKGTYNFALSDIPMSIEAVGEADKIDGIQAIMRKFVSLVNYKFANGITQAWLLPEVTDNFSDIGDSFRALIYMQGNIRIPNGNVWQIVEVDYSATGADGSWGAIGFISVNPKCDNQPDPQAIVGGSGETYTINRQSVKTLSISTYLGIDTAFTSAVKTCIESNMNATFYLRCVLGDGTYLMSRPYKLVGFSMPQTLGAIALIPLVFSRSEN